MTCLIVQVIDLGGEPIKGDEYFHLGKVTEFKYCNHIAEAMRGYYPLLNLATLGESWGMYPSGNSVGKLVKWPRFTDVRCTVCFC